MGRESSVVNVVISVDVREVADGVGAGFVFEEIGGEGNYVAAEGV